MDLPISWLADWLGGWAEGPTEIARTLERLGYEVDGMAAAEAGLRSVKLAEVLEREPHPAADRLSVLQLSLGDGERVQVVTAAPNGYPGDRVWHAPAGTVLPDGRLVGTEHLRGVRSMGMLLSGAEAGYLGAGEGLWIWRGEGRPGDPWPQVMGSDTVLQLSLTPNLAQYGHSILGVARDLAAAADRPLPVVPPAPDLSGGARLARIEARDLCPVYAVAQLECGDPSGPLPWIWQRRLALAGARLVHPVVDATNAVRIDMGQPLHAFDLDCVHLPLVVRRAEWHEALVLLDGRALALTPEDLVIADAEGPVALAGVMGGQRTAVSAKTRRVLLESAHFDRASVYRTARRHQIASDAAARFGRGTDPEAALPAVVRFHQVLTQFGASATLAAVQLEGQVPAPRHVPFRPDRLRIWTGLALGDAELAQQLDRSGFSLEAGRVRVPSWRPDIEGAQDLAEEISRIVGMEAIPARLPARAGTGTPDPEMRQADRVRDWLVAAGLTEVVTRSLIPPGSSDPLGLPPAVHVVRNPLRAEESVLRTSVWPGLLEAARYNRDRGIGRVGLFEVGPAYGGRATAPVEWLEAGILVTLGEWADLFGPIQRTVYDLKGWVDELSRRLGWGFRWGGAPPSAALHPGRSLAIMRAGELWGELGELHPSVQEAWRLPRTAVARWRIPSAAVAEHGRSSRMSPPPPYPAVRRDVSLRIPEGTSWAVIEELLHRSAGAHVESIRPFDQYQDASGPSVTVAIYYRAPDRTLTDSEVDAQLDGLVAQMEQNGISRR